MVAKALPDETTILVRQQRGLLDLRKGAGKKKWTASGHTLHMSKPVMTFVFKVLRNGLLRDILYTCPNL